MDTQIITLSDHCRFHMGDEPEAWQASAGTDFI